MPLGSLFKGNNLDQTFSWSFFGVFLSVIFGAIGIYTTFFYEKRPRLAFQQLTTSPVFSVSENVSKLDVIFDGEDIRKKDQTLTLISLRIINLGNADIYKGAFDDEHLPTITFPQSKVIQFEAAGFTDDYLRDATQLTRLSDDSFCIAPMIIEAGHSFDLKFILLHDNAVEPRIEVSGKIAGTPKLEFVEPNVTTSRSYINEVIGGAFLIQISRVAFYCLTSLIAVLALFIISEKSSEKWKALKRRSVVKKFRIGSGLKFSKQDEAIFNEYIARGEFFLLRLSQLLEDEDQLSSVISKQSGSPRYSEPDLANIPFPLDLEEYFHENKLASFLIDEEIVQVNEGKCTVNSNCRRNVIQLVTTLSILAPHQMRHFRTMDESFGNDTKPEADCDAPPLTKTPSTPQKS